VLVDDVNGEKRWSSQMPVVFTKTNSRGNAVMQMNLYNMLIGGCKYMINYATTATISAGYEGITAFQQNSVPITLNTSNGSTTASFLQVNDLLVTWNGSSWSGTKGYDWNISNIQN